ncbi:MAG: peptide-methionine (S)-S-oxide reductase MsrA [Verrucomicrobia bacterium]|nr:peptide-methionine (S)-S-oxide reductase MsrA [Verrucomicrobiota bacterium]
MSSTNDSLPTEIATLGGGCFWCVEGCYLLAPGVLKVVSGYMGGQVENPTYEQVCSGTTGVAEVVQVTFDPARLTYSDIIDLFWNAHDPTQLNRQGNDIGTQYRSVIFTHSEAQRELAVASRDAAQKAFSAPIVTEIVPASKFTPAEEYHQDYFKRNPNQPYCQFVVRPKVEKFKKALAAK